MRRLSFFLWLAQELGLPIGTENGELTGGKRVVYSGNGEITFDWKKPQPVVALPGSWANVDSRPGVVIAPGAGLGYQQARATIRTRPYVPTFFTARSQTARSGTRRARKRLCALCCSPWRSPRSRPPPGHARSGQRNGQAPRRCASLCPRVGALRSRGSRITSRPTSRACA